MRGGPSGHPARPAPSALAKRCRPRRRRQPAPITSAFSTIIPGKVGQQHLEPDPALCLPPPRARDQWGWQLTLHSDGTVTAPGPDGRVLYDTGPQPAPPNHGGDVSCPIGRLAGATAGPQRLARTARASRRVVTGGLGRRYVPGEGLRDHSRAPSSRSCWTSSSRSETSTSAGPSLLATPRSGPMPCLSHRFRHSRCDPGWYMREIS